MDIARWQQIEAVFNQALDLPLPERESFLITACGDDRDLRAELDSLLSEVSHADPFLSGTNLTLGANLLRRDSESLQGQTLGSYTLLRRLGQGGMGEVYLAHDERLGRKVALKLLPRLIVENEERARRFKHEARAASAISHPNVASVYEIGEAEGRLFIAMEFVDGSTLRDRLAQEDLTAVEAVDLTLQVAAGIAAAHAQGIIHRDIKPENVMIRRDGLVKVVDFGLAKLTERPPAASSAGEAQFSPRITRAIHTEPGLLLGTATYMSPEQARGQHVDARTDIWSLGVVFYEMLAGKPPFYGATNSDVIAEILKSEPPLLSSGLRGFPPNATQLIRRALGKDQRDRYATTAELLDSLRQLRREFEAHGLLNVKLPLPPDAVAHGNTEKPESTRGGPHQSKIQPTGVSSIGPEFSGRGGAATHRSRWLIFSAVLLVTTAVLTILVVARSHLLWQTAAHSPKPVEVIRLTTDGRVKDAAVSPDGRLLAYVPVSSGKQSLRIKDISSGEDWQILPPDLVVCWGMRFALNNQSLFYVSKQAGGTVNVLYRVPVRGGPSEKLVVNIDSPPGLSPDGMEIAFVRSYPVQHRDSLIVANVDGSDEHEILVRKHPDKLVGAGVSWSPDGKMIAVGATRNDGTQGAVLASPLDGGPPAEVTPWMWTEIAGIVWRNDGRTILFSGQKPGATALQIWKVNYPGGEVTSVTNDDNEYEEATPGPNMLVATERYEVADVWSIDQSHGPVRLTNDGHSGADGLVVTSTGRIIYTRGESFASQLWSMNLDGSNPRLLINSGIQPSVSSDGKTIAYVTFEGGHHVWLVDSDGQNNHQLTFGGGENFADIAPDGRWVFYVSRDKDRGTLWKIATTGGEPIQLTFAGIILNPMVSPDGKQIACTFRRDEGDKWKLAILPSDGGEPLQTFAFPSPFYQRIRWSHDSKSVTYLDQANGVQDIWQQPLAGGTPAKLTNFDEDRIWHYDWATSGGQFILSRGGRRRDIVMIKNVR